MKQIIVHVDDDPDIRATIRTILQKEGFDVRTYSTVESFTVSLETTRPDLVILDVMVEAEDSGLLAYDTIRQRFPLIPVVIITTLGEMILPYFEDKKESICILEKPILPERLIDTVRARLIESWPEPKQDYSN